LSSDLIPESIIDRYTPLLEKNWVQYENVLDYLNSTILEISFPGLGIATPAQTLMRGKQRNYKPATNINDITTTRELVIQFKRVDSDINYWILYDIFSYNYLNVNDTFAEPFQIIALDIHRDAIYTISFKEIILTNLSEIIFAYNQQSFDMQSFTLTFNYNFFDIEFNLNKGKVLELTPGELPIIKDRNFNSGDASKINLD
jgi:hypothetical protein